MGCDFFDPITASCAPSCIVCSHYNRCAKEKAADGDFSTVSGNTEKERGIENDHAGE